MICYRKRSLHPSALSENVNDQCFNLWSPYFRKVPIDSGEEVIHITLSLSGLVIKRDKGKIAELRRPV